MCSVAEQPIRCIASTEVINDYNGEVINLFRILNKHKEAFTSSLKYLIASREEFYRLAKQDPKYLTDIERAVRFFYTQRLNFSGRADGYSFATNKGSNSRTQELYAKASRFYLTRLLERLDKVAERLYRVVLENLDFEEFINKYDSNWVLFYLDPPYYNCENYYGKNLFKRSDFERLRNALASIKGKFIMSINDAPAIRKLFEQFTIKEVQTIYSIKTGSPKPVKELLIFNYEV